MATSISVPSIKFKKIEKKKIDPVARMMFENIKSWAEYIVEWAAKDPYGFLTTVILALTPLFLASARDLKFACFINPTVPVVLTTAWKTSQPMLKLDHSKVRPTRSTYKFNKGSSSLTFGLHGKNDIDQILQSSSTTAEETRVWIKQETKWSVNTTDRWRPSRLAHLPKFCAAGSGNTCFQSGRCPRTRSLAR
ncbi:hypothetical protein L345_10687, partial [Ophiophagus hannah]